MEGEEEGDSQVEHSRYDEPGVDEGEHRGNARFHDEERGKWVGWGR